jgi:hypothetical protein
MIIERDAASNAVIDAFCQWMADVGADNFNDVFALVSYQSRHPEHAATVARFVLDELVAAASIAGRRRSARRV